MTRLSSSPLSSHWLSSVSAHHRRLHEHMSLYCIKNDESRGAFLLHATYPIKQLKDIPLVKGVFTPFSYAAPL